MGQANDTGMTAMTSAGSTRFHADVVDSARIVVEQLNGHVVMGLPLGLGKPVQFANAIYALAAADPAIHLEIFTALTLQPPPRGRGLAARFLGPLLDRLFDGVPTLDYERDRRQNRLPPNVRVSEFYFAPGSQLGVASAQQEYVSANYTHVARDLLDRGVNLLATLVAIDETGGTPRYSLSCNPDLTLDLVQARDAGHPMLVLGQVNRQLPFMPNDAEVAAGFFDHLLDDESLEHPLFPVLNRPVSLADYATGLHVASLVPDGGTLQIGIGALGDAVANALVQRQHHNPAYQSLLHVLLDEDRVALRARLAVEKHSFEQGLFGASEMLVHSFAGLRDAGILKRYAYPHEGVQAAVNANGGDDRISKALLRALVTAQAVNCPLQEADLAVLQRFAGLDAQAQWQPEQVILADGTALSTNLADDEALAAWCGILGEQRLAGGYYLEAGFFLGPNALYRWLRGLDRRRPCRYQHDPYQQGQPAVWQRVIAPLATAESPLYQRGDDGDPDRCGGVRCAGRYAGGQRGRRAVQLRGHGPRTRRAPAASSCCRQPGKAGAKRRPTSSGTTPTPPFRGICGISWSPSTAPRICAA